MDKVVMGAMGVKVFNKTEHAWQLKIASLDLPSIKMATYKLSQ